MTEGEKIIDNCIAGVENYYAAPFPKRDGFIDSDGKRIDALIDAERERCAKIVDNLARIFESGQTYVDPNKAFNTAAQAYVMATGMARTAAEAIRKPVKAP